MAVLTPSSVFAPGRKPPKSEIIQLLEQIAGGTAGIGDFQGEWDSGSTYVEKDYVESGGNIWYALRENTNVTPTEGADWTLLLPGLTPADESVGLLQLAITLRDVVTASVKNIFVKPTQNAPAFQVKSGSGGQVLQVKAGTKVEVNGTVHSFAVDTDLTLPSLTAGKDYAVFITTSGGAQAVLWDEDTVELGAPNLPTAPSANARMVGGFHYAPGGNATGYNTGGNTTAQINPYSIWDDKYRPDCFDPRGMALVGGRFWCDIYLLNTTHSTRGTSRNGLAIAHGTVQPLIPAVYGGNGVTTYADFQWWRAVDVMSAHGKDLLSYGEFMMAAHGVIEEQTRSALPVTTGLATTNGVAANDAQYTSQWGLINAMGAHWVWGRDLSYGIFEGGYNEPPDGTSIPGSALSVVPEYIDPGLGRGWLVQENVYATRALLFGSKANNGVRGGSLCLDLANGINTSSASISARGRANHRVLQ